MAPDDALNLRILLEARLSPDGRAALYTVAEVDRERGADFACLWVVDTATAQSRRLTEPGDLITGPAWSPDGHSVAFRSLASGSPQIHIMDLDTDQVRQLTTTDWGVATTGPFWSPSGDQVAFTAAAQPPRDPAQPYRVTRQFWRMDGAGLVDDVKHELFVTDVDGGTPRQLTHDDGLIVSVEWSPDGKELLYVAYVEHDRPRTVVRSCEVSGGSVRTLYEEDNYFYFPTAAWLPDGGIARSTSNLVAADCPPVDLVIDRGSGSLDVRTDPLDGWIYGLVVGDLPLFPFLMPRLIITPDGRSGYLGVQRGGAMQVWEVAMTGDPSARAVVFGDEESSAAYDLRGDQLLIGTTSMYEPPDLYVVDVTTGDRRRLTELNADWLPAERPFDIERLRFHGADGEPVEGWFLAPRGVDGPVPTIVNNHGGPHAAWGHTFSFDNQMFLSAGYGVLLVNQRGSTGYSREFATGLHGDWGNHDISDVLAGVDLVVERGHADPDRLGVWGISAGAFLTAWITAHDHRFRAGIVESPCVSWTAMTGGDVGFHYWRWLGEKSGLGVESMSPYVRFSPTTYSGSCRTPMLIIQHEKDLRTPVATSEEYYALLRLHGCQTEMLRMPLTAHGGSLELGSPTTRVAQNEAILEWMNRHLRPADGS